MFGTISGWILTVLGWRIEGHYPSEIPKMVVAVIPHTSNWDFPLGLLVRSNLRADIKFMAKNSLFRFPYGGLFRWLGGYPVDRSKSHNYVDAVVDTLDQVDQFSLCIAPEGTRKKVERLKTGFYHIAKKAQIPIILCRFDYGRKVVSFSEPFYPTDDADKDLSFIIDHFKGIKGKNPEWGFG